MEQAEHTDLKRAQFMSKISGKPVHVHDDIFVWKDAILSKELATVILLKGNNNIPVTKESREQLYIDYIAKFANHPLRFKSMYEDGVEDQSPSYDDFVFTNSSEYWFRELIEYVFRSNDGCDFKWSADSVKSLLVYIHN